MIAPGAHATAELVDNGDDPGVRVAARVAATVRSKSSWVAMSGFYGRMGGMGRKGWTGRRGRMDRRDFLTAVGVLGAGAVVGTFPDAFAQTASRAAGRIDVHHHVTPPKYLAELASRNLAAADMRAWSVARTLDDMEK